MYLVSANSFSNKRVVIIVGRLYFARGSLKKLRLVDALQFNHIANEAC